jgi:hypothetical protein
MARAWAATTNRLLFLIVSFDGGDLPRTVRIIVPVAGGGKWPGKTLMDF